MEQIKDILKSIEVNSLEFIPLLKPFTNAQYDQWLADSKQGQMDYMAKNQEVRKNPAEHFKPMKSLIMFTHNYFPLEKNSSATLAGLKLAHYARMKDYHLWFRAKLNQGIDLLKQQFPDEQFLAFTDAVPLLERDHGAQAALGWIGKNTCLIHPNQGSLFFIGEILTSLECDQSFLPMHDFCGSCTACIEACPTEALNEQRQLDANLCLSHWNIESREIPPIEIREKMSDWFFGCDICQTVCPWNMKLFKNHPDFINKSISHDQQIKDLKYILNHSNKQLFKDLKETPLSRAGGRGLKRNALIVIGNLKIKELLKDVEAYLEHPQLAELAKWTHSKLLK